MKLFLSPLACSFATHIIAQEAGIAFEPVWVNLDIQKHVHTLRDGSDFALINPKGAVPALQTDDGQMLTEVAVIAQYLADLRPDSGLLSPKVGMARYRVLEWMNYIGTEIHKNFGPLFYLNTPAEYRTIATQNLAHRFTWVDGVLSRHQYLNGDQFTVADAYFYIFKAWAPVAGIDLGQWKNISAYLDRVGEREAVRKTEAVEQAAMPT